MSHGLGYLLNGPNTYPILALLGQIRTGPSILFFSFFLFWILTGYVSMPYPSRICVRYVSDKYPCSVVKHYKSQIASQILNRFNKKDLTTL